MIPTHSGGRPSIFSPVRVRTITMPRRITDWETHCAIRAPRKVPGVPPSTSGTSTARSMPSVTTCPMAAASTSGPCRCADATAGISRPISAASAMRPRMSILPFRTATEIEGTRRQTSRRL